MNSLQVDAHGLHRPRVEGEREREIFEATLQVLAEVGYDRLTMDAVATRAKAGKATLYRRWNGKPELVVATIMSFKGTSPEVDTGTLRGDLITLHCGQGGLTDQRAQTILSVLVTAMTRDPEFADIYRRDFIGSKMARTREAYVRAQARGEIADDLDLDLIAPALAGITLHRAFLLGDHATPALIERIVDTVILPAVGLSTAH